MNYLNALDIQWIEISSLLFPTQAAVFTRAASMSIK